MGKGSGWTLPNTKLQAKKTPLGERGVRVIVVVANSVSAKRTGYGGFFL